MNFLDCLEMIIDGDVSHYIDKAVRLDRMDLVKFLSNYGRQDKGLEIAIELGRNDLARFFLDSGEDVELALVFAVNANNVEIARYCIEKGAKDFREALYMAQVENKSEMVDLLS